MLINNRVIFNDNSTLIDLSASLNDIFSSSETVGVVFDEDYLYIGSDLPFNHRYFNVSTANDQTSAVSVDIWSGSAWNPAVDVVDQTKGSAGKTLSQSGIISWTTDRNKSWGSNDTTENMTGSGLTSLKIYGLYWVRLSFSADLKATTALKYVGHKFSRDTDLGGYYSDLTRSNVMSGFKAAKTNWDEQHVLAAEEIIRDLRKKQIIWSRNQIFGWEEFVDASVHKVAEIAYSAFGADYEERRKVARERYDEALDKLVFAVDKDEDGRVEESEQRSNHRRLVRI
jgi:hypothetical protein